MLVFHSFRCPLETNSRKRWSPENSGQRGMLKVNWSWSQARLGQDSIGESLPWYLAKFQASIKRYPLLILCKNSGLTNFTLLSKKDANFILWIVLMLREWIIVLANIIFHLFNYFSDRLTLTCVLTLPVPFVDSTVTLRQHKSLWSKI